MQYLNDGWKIGLPDSIIEKSKVTRKSKPRSEKEILCKRRASICYEYDNQLFYGNRALRKYLNNFGYDTISQITINKLSKGIPVKGYEALLGKIIIVKNIYKEG